MISRIIRISGLATILAITFTCIFLSLVVKDIPQFHAQNRVSSHVIFKYPSVIEDMFYDYRIHRSSNIINQKIVLAEIDDFSLNKLGQWPLHRSVYANLIRKMKTFGAKIVSFDVFFPEAALSCADQTSPDIDFANSIREFQEIPGNHIILPYSFYNKSGQTFEELPDTLLDFILNTHEIDGVETNPTKISKNAWPIDTLLEAKPALGHIGASADIDGVFRGYPLVGNVEKLYFPSLALLSYELYTGQKSFFDMRNMSIKLEDKDIKLGINFMGETKIRWFGGVNNFPRVNIHTILNAPDNDQKLKKIFNNNVVFLGSSAYGAHDLRHTPVDSQLPGVYAHMNVLHMIMENFHYQSKDDSAKITWYIVIAASLLMIIIQIFGHAIFDTLGVITICTGLIVYDNQYLLPNGYEIKLFFCLLSVALCYLWTTLLNFYLTSKEKKQIKGTFSRYVSPAIVNEMLSDPEKLKVGGEKKDLTVFFSDVRDFTSISEQLTPEMLSKSLNYYMGHMTDIVFENLGTLDKYIGDAIVAFWNAPLPVENHAYHAVKASLEMIEILPKINVQLTEWGVPEFKHGIGLNTGECSVGNMGSEKIFAYTALGDSMNLGARLESLCKFYGVQLNVSEYTLNAIPKEFENEFKWRILDKVRVKGKKEAVTIYEILHSFHPFMKDEQAREEYNGAFKLYLEKKFKSAAKYYKELKEKYPDDKSSTRMFNMCMNFIDNPPPENWDGAYTHTSKG
ncbi:MAG: adenylate/guanylate cyclase domain-containing protein [Bacteriovoracaceae bacterium]|nr:adenylate/guanylate cyclase domain-containing protein [Bacteriovoracaceae bacterium]